MKTSTQTTLRNGLIALSRSDRDTAMRAMIALVVQLEKDDAMPVVIHGNPPLGLRAHDNNVFVVLAPEPSLRISS